jgi:hypothetical protein
VNRARKRLGQSASIPRMSPRCRARFLRGSAPRARKEAPHAHRLRDRGPPKKLPEATSLTTCDPVLGEGQWSYGAFGAYVEGRLGGDVRAGKRKAASAGSPWSG